MMWSDTNQFSPTDIPLATDIDSIFQSIENILSTVPGQRVFNPEFGSYVENYLFEIMDDRTALLIEHEVIRAIGRWEPRVELVPQLTSIIPSYDYHRYDVRIVFKIKGPDNQQYEYKGILERKEHGAE